MKIKKLNIDPERKLITNLIVSDEFSRQIMPIFNPNIMKSEYSKIIGGWIKEYFEVYKVAPGKNIQELYREKRGKIRKEEVADLVAEFLTNLSKDYENSIPNNIDFSIKQATHYLKIRSMEELIENLQDAVNKDDDLIAEKIVSEYSRVEVANEEGVSLLTDTQEIIDAFNEDEEFLFHFNGAVGNVIGDLHRGDFFSFMAPMKRGKSWWLWYSAEVAMKKGLKVVFFTLEMTKKQMVRRAWRSLVGRPKKTKEVIIPYFSEVEGKDTFEILTKIEEINGVNINEIKEQQKTLKLYSRKGGVKIVQLSGYKATVNNIEAHLDNMSYYDNYVPDVVVIDYADLLASTRKMEYRHQLDDVWKGLRRISQERNILVVTASQTTKETFDRDVKRGDASEDIRKIAHVTAAVAINQKDNEKEKGIIRISNLVVREEAQVTGQAVALQCLDIGKACLDSKMVNELEEFETKHEEKHKRRRE